MVWTQKKKSLFNRSAEEAWKSVRAVAGQAKADAPSVRSQYHHHAVADTPAEGRKRAKRLEDASRCDQPQEAGRYQTHDFRVNTIAHFSLTSKHFSRINGSDPSCIFAGSRCRLLLICRRVTVPDRGGSDQMAVVGDPAGHGRHRPHRVRRHAGRGIQGPHPRRARERHRDPPQSDPRPARRRSARQHRRHRRHERQPGLRRRQADRRGVVRARQLLQGTDRRHHADRGDDRRDDDERPPGARVKVDFPLTRENLTAAFRKALNWNRPFADRPNDAQLTGVSAVAGLGGSQLGTLLRPIATPLVMSGFEPELADMLGSAFREQGFIPTGGSAPGVSRGEMPFDGPAEAGRRDRRHVRQRRSAVRRHRHRHAHRRRPRLRLRPSDVQPRADRVPDDARLRLHGAAEPVLVDEAVEHGRGHRHVPRRIARRRSPAASAPGRA